MKRILLIITAMAAMSIGAFAQCATFPCVVATTTLTHQTHAISPTVLYTPTAEGTFRVNLYMSATNAGTDQGLWELVLRWTDSVGEKHALFGTPHMGDSTATFPVHAVAGQPLEYRTFATPSRSQVARSYDLYIVVEQLQ